MRDPTHRTSAHRRPCAPGRTEAPGPRLREIVKPPSVYISSRSSLRGFWYNKGILAKWNRADQVLHGMRWDYYRTFGIRLADISLIESHFMRRHAQLAAEESVERMRPPDLRPSCAEMFHSQEAHHAAWAAPPRGAGRGRACASGQDPYQDTLNLRALQETPRQNPAAAGGYAAQTDDAREVAGIPSRRMVAEPAPHPAVAAYPEFRAKAAPAAYSPMEESVQSGTVVTPYGNPLQAPALPSEWMRSGAGGKEADEAPVARPCAPPVRDVRGFGCPRNHHKARSMIQVARPPAPSASQAEMEADGAPQVIRGMDSGGRHRETLRVHACRFEAFAPQGDGISRGLTPPAESGPGAVERKGTEIPPIRRKSLRLRHASADAMPPQ